MLSMCPKEIRIAGKPDLTVCDGANSQLNASWRSRVSARGRSKPNFKVRRRSKLNYTARSKLALFFSHGLLVCEYNIFSAYCECSFYSNHLNNLEV